MLGDWGLSVGNKLVADFVMASRPPQARESAVPRPVYEPEKWNLPSKVALVNCYGYALRSEKWLDVGEIGDKSFTLTNNRLFNRAISDGLMPARFHNPPDIEGYYLVACFAGRGWHWYQKHEDGTWSSKNGRDEVTNMDESGKIITNILTADHGPINQHVGNFYVPNEGVSALRR